MFKIRDLKHFEENETATASIMQYAVSECFAATCFISNYAEFELLIGDNFSADEQATAADAEPTAE